MAITGYELRETRAEFRENQAEFAARLDVSPRTIFTWEKTGVPPKSERQVLRAIGRVLYKVRGDIAQQEYFESDAYMEDVLQSDPARSFDLDGWKGDLMFARYQRRLAEVGAQLEGLSTEDLIYELLRRDRDPKNTRLREWKAMFVESDVDLTGDEAEEDDGSASGTE